MRAREAQEKLKRVSVKQDKEKKKKKKKKKKNVNFINAQVLIKYGKLF